MAERAGRNDRNPEDIYFKTLLCNAIPNAGEDFAHITALTCRNHTLWSPLNLVLRHTCLRKAHVGDGVPTCHPDKDDVLHSQVKKAMHCVQRRQHFLVLRQQDSRDAWRFSVLENQCSNQCCSKTISIQSKTMNGSESHQC